MKRSLKKIARLGGGRRISHALLHGVPTINNATLTNHDVSHHELCGTRDIHVGCVLAFSPSDVRDSWRLSLNASAAREDR